MGPIEFRLMTMVSRSDGQGTVTIKLNVDGQDKTAEADLGRQGSFYASLDAVNQIVPHTCQRVGCHTLTSNEGAGLWSAARVDAIFDADPICGLAEDMEPVQAALRAYIAALNIHLTRGTVVSVQAVQLDRSGPDAEELVN